MSYKIETTTEEEYLKLIVSGEQTLTVNKALVIEIIDSCIEHQTGKVMVDIRRFKGQQGVIPDFELANFAVAKGLTVIKKAALIYNKDAHQSTTFFETVARNRGLNLRIFLNESDAEAWLLRE